MLRRDFTSLLAASPLIGLIPDLAQKPYKYIFEEVHLGPGQIPEFPLHFLKPTTPSLHKSYFWSLGRVNILTGADKLILPMFVPDEDIGYYSLELLMAALEQKDRKALRMKHNKVIVYQGDKVGVAIL